MLDERLDYSLKRNLKTPLYSTSYTVLPLRHGGIVYLLMHRGQQWCGIISESLYMPLPPSLPRPIIPPKGYPHKPRTIGEHIRKRRLDLGLLQSDVARIIGVTESTVWKWEHGKEPELRHMPKIIEFLGYVPFELPDDPLGKLRYFKQVNGLSYERL